MTHFVTKNCENPEENFIMIRGENSTTPLNSFTDGIILPLV